MATIKKAQKGTVVPNAYKVVKNKVAIKDSLGQPTGRFKEKSDTLYMQKPGEWDINLGEKNKPKAIIKPKAKTGAKISMKCGGKAKKKK